LQQLQRIHNSFSRACYRSAAAARDANVVVVDDESAGKEY
jgi:hypothetical protein